MQSERINCERVALTRALAAGSKSRTNSLSARGSAASSLEKLASERGGNVSMQGVLPFAPSYDNVGWFALDAMLLRCVGDVLLPRAAGAPLRRLACARDVFALADGDAAERLRLVAQSLGADVDIDVFEDGPMAWLAAYATLQGAEIHAQLGDWIAAHRPRFGASIGPRFEGLAAITDADVARWQPWRARQAQRLRARLADGTVLVLPTTPGPALLKAAAGEALSDFYTRALAINALAGHAGLPQITLPLATVDGRADGAPLGLSLIGGLGSDGALLAFATALGPLDGAPSPT